MTFCRAWSAATTALGIIPLGMANALAHDSAAAPFRGRRSAGPSDSKAPRIALGRVEYADLEGNRGSRFFTVAAASAWMRIFSTS